MDFVWKSIVEKGACTVHSPGISDNTPALLFWKTKLEEIKNIVSGWDFLKESSGSPRRRAVLYTTAEGRKLFINLV